VSWQTLRIRVAVAVGPLKLRPGHNRRADFDGALLFSTSPPNHSTWSIELAGGSIATRSTPRPVCAAKCASFASSSGGSANVTRPGSDGITPGVNDARGGLIRLALPLMSSNRADRRQNWEGRATGASLARQLRIESFPEFQGVESVWRVEW